MGADSAAGASPAIAEALFGLPLFASVLAEGPAAVGNHTIILKLYSVLKKITCGS